MPNLHHLKGWHDSPKAGRVFYRSSYEKKAFIRLDEDETIRNYQAEKVSVAYFNPRKKITSTYLIDLKLQFTDGSEKFVEIKPKKWLDDAVVKSKIAAGREFAVTLGMPFEVWTEAELFGLDYKDKDIKEFIDSIKSNPQIIVDRKKKNVEKVMRHYEKHIKNDKITVFCEFCQKEHTIMTLSYKQNIARNGRFVCIKENGSIVGKQPKIHLRKINEYAKIGSKECTKCKQILPFENFGKDKSRRDGYASRCKNCRNSK